MRYLIVGYGNIGHKRKDALGKKCIATADPIPKAEADFKNYKDVPIDIFDTAVLTVPQQFKLEMVKYFLSKGKHVLVEKPLIITQTQGKKLKYLSSSNKVIWTTSYNHQFEPNIMKLSDYLKRGVIGKLYYARLIYSFGNIKERIGTWRETEFGVLEEIAPHLIDFVNNNFNYDGSDYQLISARKIESNIYDHWIFSTKDGKILIEISSIIWKNIFSMDIYGEKGSLHMNGLCKWKGSELTLRKRVYPAGIPKEKKWFVKGPDLTWVKDFNYFERVIKTTTTTYENDLQISDALLNLIKNAKKQKR